MKRMHLIHAVKVDCINEELLTVGTMEKQILKYYLILGPSAPCQILRFISVWTNDDYPFTFNEIVGL